MHLSFALTRSVTTVAGACYAKKSQYSGSMYSCTAGEQLRRPLIHPAYEGRSNRRR